MEAESEEDRPPLEGSRFFERRERRHQENLQILVASGLFGAYFALYPNKLPSQNSLSLAVNTVFVTNSLFLLFKLTINSRNPFTDWGFLEPIDRYIPLVYLFSIYLSAFVVGVTLLSEELGVSISAISEHTGLIAIIGTFVFVVVTSFYGSRYQARKGNEKREKVRHRLMNALILLEEGNVIDENVRNAMWSRYQDVLDKDDERSMWAHQNGLLGAMASEPLRLSNSDLGYLLNVINRIENRAENEVYKGEDHDVLEKILRHAEEKTS